MRNALNFCAVVAFFVAELICVIQGASLVKMLVTSFGSFAIIFFLGNGICTIFEKSDSDNGYDQSEQAMMPEFPGPAEAFSPSPVAAASDDQTVKSAVAAIKEQPEKTAKVIDKIIAQ